jgi:tetratricopeptide (TPR) repeat protein
VLYGRRGAVAGLLLALYPPAIFLDGLLEKSALVTFLLALMLAAVAAAQSDWRSWLAAGAALGLLSLARENALILLVPLLLWIAFAARAQWKPATALIGGCAVVLLPVAVRNRAVGGEWVLTTSQFGPNFYIGNHAGAAGTYQALAVGHGSAVDEREDATRLAEQAAARKLTPREVSGYWTGRSLDYIRAQPISWLAILARKLALTFNAAEVSDTESQQVYAEASWLLRLLEPYDFGVLLAFAVIGVVLTRTSWRELWWLYALVAAYAVSVVLFYVFARYRFPITPVLMLIAAGGLTRLVEVWKTDRRLVAIAAADAMEFYRRSLAVDPHFPAAHFGLATLDTRLGRSVEAVPHFRTAIAAWPDFAEAHYNLGLHLRCPRQNSARASRSAEALECYRKALELQPRSAPALVGAGVALAETGRTAEAIEKYRLALDIDPLNAAAHNSLGTTLAATGHQLRPGYR